MEQDLTDQQQPCGPRGNAEAINNSVLAPTASEINEEKKKKIKNAQIFTLVTCQEILLYTPDSSILFSGLVSLGLTRKSDPEPVEDKRFAKTACQPPRGRRLGHLH